MVDPSNLDEILNAIRKRYGKESAMFGDQKSDVKRIPFNNIQLDWATIGGVPMGRWSHFYGPPSAGKSLLSLKVIATAQKMGMNAAYYDVEKTFVPSWAEQMGVDTSSLLVLRPTVIEDLGTQMESLMEVVNIHVIDSIAAASPLGELAKTMEDQQIGLSARTWNKLLRRIQHRLTDEHCIILINQLRTAMQGNVVSEKPSGGRFLQHEASLALDMRIGPRLYYKKGILSQDGDKLNSPTGDNKPDGMELVINVAKSKVGGRGRTARLRFDFATGQFDELWSLAMFAQFFEMVNRSGAWYSINGDKVQGEAGLRSYIETHPEFSDMIRQKVMESA